MCRHARTVTELVSGVTRWRRRLDYTLTALLRGVDLGTLDAPVRNVLRLGLYELAELQSECTLCCCCRYCCVGG